MLTIEEQRKELLKTVKHNKEIYKKSYGLEILKRGRALHRQKAYTDLLEQALRKKGLLHLIEKAKEEYYNRFTDGTGAIGIEGIDY